MNNSFRISYYKEPNPKIYLVKVDDQENEQGKPEVDTMEVVATQQYVCKSLAIVMRNQKAHSLVTKMKKNQLEQKNDLQLCHLQS